MSENHTPPAVDNYAAIRKRMKELHNPTTTVPDIHRDMTPGFETWVREITNGNIELQVELQRKARRL